MTFNIKEYLENKEKGLINKVLKTNVAKDSSSLTYAVFTKKYEPDLSSVPPVYVQSPDEVSGVTSKEIEDRLTELQDEIDSITQFKLDAIE